MSDFKSKLPDFKEIVSISSKLFNDLKTSVSEIVQDYKKKHMQNTAKPKASSPEKKKQETAAAKPKKTTPKAKEESK